MAAKPENGIDAMVAGRRYRPFLLVLLFFSFALAYQILAPFLNVIIFGVVIASLLYPLQLRLVKAYGGRRNLAATTVMTVLVFLILIPLFFFFSALVKQGLDSVAQVNDWIRAGNLERFLAHPKLKEFYGWLSEHLAFLQLDQLVHLDRVKIQDSLLQFGKNFGQFLVSRGASLLGDMAGVIMHFFLMVFVCFYLIRDGEELVESIKYLSPLRSSQEDRIIDKIRAVARSALLGSFVTALCQGLAGAIGLAIVGMPGLFWGTVMGFCSFIPVVGTALIWVPAVGYLMLLGKWKLASFLGLWCIILVGSIDNFLRPMFMKGQAEMSTFYIFLSIIGGVQYFGLAGVLYGPLILAFAKVMLYIYQVEYQDLLDEPQPPATEIASGAGEAVAEE